MTRRRTQRLLPLMILTLAACAPTPRAPLPVPRPITPPPPPPRRVIIGAVIPQSGPPALTQYGDLVLQGVRLAIDSINGPQLLVMDDGGDLERDPGLVRELESEGAVAVIGPLLSPGLAAGARERADTSLVLISPTASTLPVGLPNVYSLNVPDEQGMVALAQYAASVGAVHMAMLYPRTAEYLERARAFAAALQAAGGIIVADVPYDSGTTTFRTQLERVKAALPSGLAVLAPERDVRQIAPQIAYYGVSGPELRIFGSEEWTSEEILRLVPPRYTNGVMAATPLVRESPAAGWQEFARLYESTYRRTLNTPFPALGYDAARLILSAIEHGQGAPSPAEVAHFLAILHGFRGATGVLSVRMGSIMREPFLVRIENGQLIPLRSPTPEPGESP